MAKKYYVVWQGRETGIFTSWAQCKAQVDNFSGARFKSFPSLEEAQAAFGRPSKLKASTTKAKTSKPKSTPLTQSQIDAMPYAVKIFTDGACEPNPGEAGTGLAVYQDQTLSELWYGLYQAHGTNNTAELHGLNQALLLAKEKLLQGYSVGIYSDSRYSIDCLTKWAVGWEKKGWTKSDGEIKNLDIIKPMYALYQQIKAQINIHHVNGHVGIEGNELADRMSIVAIQAREPNLCRYTDTDDLTQILALRAG